MEARIEEVNVENYLTKHNVTALFEELMAKVTKQLPQDPIEFLIKKLQLLQQRQKKKVVAPNVASISPAKMLPQGSRIQVTGMSLASKTSKPPVSEQMRKSKSGLRPLKSKPIGFVTSSSYAKSVPARTPITRGACPATSCGTSKVALKSGNKLKPLSSSSSRSTTVAKPSMSRPTTAPGTMKAVVGLPTKVSRHGVTVSSPRKKMLQSPAKTCPSAKIKLEDELSVKEKDVVAGIIDEKKNEKATVHKNDVSREQIDESFGDDKKSSQKVFYVESEEEVGGMESDEDEDEGLVGMLSTADNNDDSLDIQTIRRRMAENANGRHWNKKSHHRNLQSLLLEEPVSTTPLSLGFHDATESSDSECEVELFEDGDALRDEGVEVTKETHVILRKSAATSVMAGGSVMCARCARALGEEDAPSSVPPSLDFESASQVDGPVTYPHWRPDSSSNEGLHTKDSDQNVSSQVTFQSDDTWGGLAPPALPELQLSDEESEVQLPPGLPLEGYP